MLYTIENQVKLNGIKISKINSIWNSDTPKSIHDLSIEAVNMLFSLSKIDGLFKRFEFVRKDDSKINFDVEVHSKDEMIKIISENILKANASDILEYENENNPTLSFRRDFGFNLLFNFFQKEKPVFSYIPKLGAKGRNAHALSFFQSYFEPNYDWCIKVFKQLIQKTEAYPIYGCIGLSDSEFSKRVKREMRIEWPIEIASYFSLEVDQNIQKLDVQKERLSNQGVYVFPVTITNFGDEQSLKELRDMLLSLNEEMIK